MVVFNCNACGEVLKKNQVGSHVTRCRGCQVISCADCGKDFWGDDYQFHTKCMTESEKYCGKGYVPKANKGEVKQEQWIEKVQNAIEKSASNPAVRGLLESLKDFPNIPRKQQKFQNFLANSLRVRNPGVIAKVWELLMAVKEEEAIKENKNEKTQQTQENGSSKTYPDNGLNSGQNQTEQKCDERAKILTKPEKKTERREKANKNETKDKETYAGESESRKIKNKKRKRDTEEEVQEKTDEGSVKKKKDKTKQKATGDHEEAANVDQNGNVNGSDRLNNEDEQTEVGPNPKKRKKFRWEEVIVQVLESKGEISFKKLRKKVLKEFAALDAANYDKESLRVKFETKLKKMAQVKVDKDRVKLK